VPTTGRRGCSPGGTDVLQTQEVTHQPCCCHPTTGHPFLAKEAVKNCDLVFKVPPGLHVFWPSQEHEPLLVSLTLRFACCPPWQLRQSPSVLALGRELQDVWEAEGRDERPLLRQLSVLPGTLEAL